MEEVLNIIRDETLTYQQQLLALARLAENMDDTLQRSPEYRQGQKDGIFCDLGEGLAPYRPRYICPDYTQLMEKGSRFLDLTPPQDLLEATNALLIMYHHVPSITSFPVYLGNLDQLLEPFVLKETPQRAKQILKMFLLHIDRTLTDSFVHADLGPEATRTGELILQLSEEMQCAMPNLTLKYDPLLTSDDFLKRCALCMLKTAKPSFANHAMFTREWGENYAIASCYNGLKVGGGGFTLPRIRLYECSLKAKDPQDFLDNVLPHYVQIMLETVSYTHLTLPTKA